jgi:hypothetical protein
MFGWRPTSGGIYHMRGKATYPPPHRKNKRKFNRLYPRSRITEAAQFVAERRVGPRRLHSGSPGRGGNDRSLIGGWQRRHAVHLAGSTQWKTPITSRAIGTVVARLKVLFLDAIAGRFRFQIWNVKRVELTDEYSSIEHCNIYFLRCNGDFVSQAQI